MVGANAERDALARGDAVRQDRNRNAAAAGRLTCTSSGPTAATGFR